MPLQVHNFKTAMRGNNKEFQTAWLHGCPFIVMKQQIWFRKTTGAVAVL